MGEGLFDGAGKAIANMPPTLAALVIMGLAIAALVYAWRKSGDEAKREKARSEADGIHGKLDGLAEKLDGLAGGLTDIKTGIEVLKDRRRG